MKIEVNNSIIETCLNDTSKMNSYLDGLTNESVVELTGVNQPFIKEVQRSIDMLNFQKEAHKINKTFSLHTPQVIAEVVPAPEAVLLTEVMPEPEVAPVLSESKTIKPKAKAK